VSICEPRLDVLRIMLIFRAEVGEDDAPAACMLARGNFTAVQDYMYR
jgi:hypothetical protein